MQTRLTERRWFWPALLGAAAALGIDRGAMTVAALTGTYLSDWDRLLLSTGAMLLLSLLTGLMVRDRPLLAAFATALLYGYLVLLLETDLLRVAGGLPLPDLIARLLGPVAVAVVFGLPAGLLAWLLRRRGAAAPTAAPPTTAAPNKGGRTMYCSNCGQPLAAGVRFCPACGAPNAYAAAVTGATAARPAPAPPPALGRRRPGAWIAVLAVLAVAAGAYWGLRGGEAVNTVRGGAAVSTFRGGAGLTGIFPGSGPVQAPKQVWEYKPDGRPGWSVLSGDTLFVTAESGKVYALNADTGALRWQSSGVEILPFVATGGRLYFSSQSGGVQALDAASGKQLWQTALGDGMVLLNYGAGNLYGATSEGELLALDPATGSLRWRYHTGGKGDFCVPAALPDAVYAICGDDGRGKGASVDAVTADGTRLWQWQRPDLEVTGFAADSTAVYVAGGTGLTALDARTGQEQWGSKLAGKAGVAVQGNRVYLVAGDLVALSAATRQEVWRAKGVADAESLGANAALAGNTIYAAVGGRLTALDSETGRQLWQVQGFTGIPIPGRGMVFGVAKDKVSGWK